MAALADFLRVGAAQNVDQMRRAEHLAARARRIEKKTRLRRRVDEARRRPAIVAIAAGLARLAEMREQRLTAAAGHFAKRAEFFNAPLLAHARRFARIIVEHPYAAHHIAGAVEQNGARWRAVAARAADLLIISFDRRRHVGVDDETDVRLVDAHAEGDRRDNDEIGLGEEIVEEARSRLRVEARMIGGGAAAVLVEEGGELLGLAARQAIDNALLAIVVFQEVENTGLRARLALD